MKYLLTIFVAMAASRLWAEEPCASVKSPFLNWKYLRCWCADDYLGKAAPCVARPAQGCVDDYCPKMPPTVAPNARGCVDDYCPKAFQFLGKLTDCWYRCVPSR